MINVNVLFKSKIFIKRCLLLPLIIIIIIFLLRDGTEDTPELRIWNFRIWKNTPAYDLALAVKNQNVSRINKIAKVNPKLLNYKEPNFGITLLMWSVGVNKFRSAEALLKNGANPNIISPYGESALYFAADDSWVSRNDSNNPKYIHLLLKYGANPNIYYIGGNPIDNMEEPGTSPLMISITHSFEKTKALVEGGADINHKTPSKNTAAIEALIHCEYAPEIAYYLIVEKKANVSEPNIRGPFYTLPGQNPNDKFYPINLLRHWLHPIGSKEHTMKMAIVKEFKRQGIDYWKTTIPDDVLGQIKKLYPNTWQDYMKKY